MIFKSHSISNPATLSFRFVIQSEPSSLGELRFSFVQQFWLSTIRTLFTVLIARLESNSESALAGRWLLPRGSKSGTCTSHGVSASSANGSLPPLVYTFNQNIWTVWFPLNQETPCFSPKNGICDNSTQEGYCDHSYRHHRSVYSRNLGATAKKTHFLASVAHLAFSFRS